MRAMLCGHVRGSRVRPMLDTWTNMDYWRGVKAPLALGRDSFQPLILSEEAADTCCGESRGSSPWGRQGTLDGLCRGKSARGWQCGKGAHTCGDGECGLGPCCSVSPALGEGVRG